MTEVAQTTVQMATERAGYSDEWNPTMSFNEKGTNPKDYLTQDERRRIREAALEYTVQYQPTMASPHGNVTSGGLPRPAIRETKTRDSQSRLETR